MQMQTLYDPLSDRVRYADKTLRINTAYRRVLQCCCILNDSVIDDRDKVDLCLRLMLKPISRLRICSLTTTQKNDVLNTVFRDFVATGGKSEEKSFDFDQDAGYIYAAFWQVYGLDLLGKDKNLHWWKFVQLLGGLPEDARLMQIISIRTRPLPKPTKYNAAERSALLRLKSLYRLKVDESQREKSLVEGLRKMAAMLEGLANANDKN